jgi:1,4-dihydroxy-2-naphthoyl-CoA synthase
LAKWKAIRDEIVKLNADGQHQQAKKSRSGECRSHAQHIREALETLNSFSEKRADDFDSSASKSSMQ